MTIFLVIAALVALILLVALFSKKGYAIQREITINRPVQAVFDYLKHIKNQDYFSKWVMMDPNLKKSFRGTDGTVGFVYAWEGNKKAGKGEQEIKGIKEGERLDLEVRFEKPFEGIAQTPFTTVPANDHETKVTWSTSSTMKYPMNIMLLLMNMDKMLGKDMDESLLLLKNILEKEG